MMKRQLRLSACVLTLLSGCASDSGGGMPLPQMTFAQVRPMAVNVQGINVRAAESDAAYDFAIDPAEAARQYVDRRFVAAGPSGTLDVSIETATVTKKHEEASNKVASFLNVAGMDSYEIALGLRFEHIENGGRLAYGKLLNARRVVHIQEHASIAERERLQLEAMENLFADMDKEVRILVLEDRTLMP